MFLPKSIVKNICVRLNLFLIYQMLELVNLFFQLLCLVNVISVPVGPARRLDRSHFIVAWPVFKQALVLPILIIFDATRPCLVTCLILIRTIELHHQVLVISLQRGPLGFHVNVQPVSSGNQHMFLFFFLFACHVELDHLPYLVNLHHSL